jgi:hypothetical protein
MSVLILLKTIIIYSLPAITLIGLITNSMSLIIFSRKRFRGTIFSTYFRIYLVIEITKLIFPINKMFELNLGMYFHLISDFCCKLRRFFSNCNFAITSSFLVVISIDRYLSIAYPTKFLFRKKGLFQLIISFFIIGVNCCIYIPFSLYFLKEIRKNVTNQTVVISYECASVISLIKFINLFQEFAIPFILMFLFSSLTIKTVFNSRRSSSNNSSVVKSRDIKFAVSSISINILFLLFNSPYFILFLLNDNLKLLVNIEDLSKFLYAISYFLYYFSSCLSLFTNYFTNYMFRKELDNFFTCRKKRNLSISRYQTK